MSHIQENRFTVLTTISEQADDSDEPENEVTTTHGASQHATIEHPSLVPSSGDSLPNPASVTWPELSPQVDTNSEGALANGLAQTHGSQSSADLQSSATPRPLPSPQSSYATASEAGDETHSQTGHPIGEEVQPHDSPPPQLNANVDDPPSNEDGSPVADLVKPLEQCAEFWEKYNETADAEDKEFVRAAGGDLDVLLIFAGLFSAVNTAFIIEAYKSLKTDPVDETNRLLRSVATSLQSSPNTDSTTEAPQAFVASNHDVMVNTFFFLSLCCSLSAAFGAVLAKQWLTQCDRDGGRSLEPQTARGRRRQRRYNGRDKWHLEDVIATLPTLLQLSLFFFLVGLIMFLWPLNTQIAWIIISFAIVTFLFYVATISISILDPSSPFQTRFSVRLHLLWLRWRGVLTLLLVLVTWWTGLVVSILIASGALKMSMRAEKAAAVICVTGGLGMLNFGPGGVSDLLDRFPFLPPICQALGRVLDNCLDRFKSFLSVAKPIDAAFRHVFHRFFHKATIQQANLNTYDPAHDARCVAYLLGRVTTSEGLHMLTGALSFISDNSSAIPIAEAFITFHLRPQYQSGCWVLQGLSSPIRKQLLQILYILLARGAYYDSTSASTQLFLPEDAYPNVNRARGTAGLAVRLPQAICQGLWSAFLADPQDQELFELILKISIIRPPFERPKILTPAMVDWDAVGKALCNDGDRVVQQRCLTLLDATNDMVCPSQTLSLGFRRSWYMSYKAQGILYPTMWTDVSTREPNLDGFWSTMLRIQALPVLILNQLLDSHFAEYLALSFMHYAIPNYETMKRDPHTYHLETDRWEQWSLYWSYILATRYLLAQGDPQVWPRELRTPTHLFCLLTILKGVPVERHRAGTVLALYSFLSLWAHGPNEENSDGENSDEGNSDEENSDEEVTSLYDLYEEGVIVQTIVAIVTSQVLDIHATIRSIEKAGGIYAGMTANDDDWKRGVWDDIRQMMTWMLSYLRKTIEGGKVAAQEVNGVSRGYKHWCTVVDGYEFRGDNLCAALRGEMETVAENFWTNNGLHTAGASA